MVASVGNYVLLHSCSALSERIRALQPSKATRTMCMYTCLLDSVNTREDADIYETYAHSSGLYTPQHACA